MSFYKKKSYYSEPSANKAPKPRMTNPSEYQKNIFNAIEESVPNVLMNLACGGPITAIHIDALAGCGKTSTLIEKDYYLPESLLKDSIQIAFNSDIAKVLGERVADGVSSKTLHALGRAAVVRAFPNLAKQNALNPLKYRKYISASFGNEAETLELRDNLAKMIDRARDCMAFNKEKMKDLINQFDIDTCTLTEEVFLATAERILLQGLNDVNTMDYGDMIALAIFHNLNLVKYSVLSVDEAQDLCPIQHELVKRSIKPGGFLISVGDENQAIYLWRGAASNSIDDLVSCFNSKRYSLPRTYRCGKKIVEFAREIVPGLECPDNAHEGEILEIDISRIMDHIKPGDALLSRLNAPLVKLCFAMIKNGIPANIEGRDVAERLKNLIKMSKANSINDLLDWVYKWRDTEVERRQKANKSTTLIEDNAECLEILCEGKYSVADVVFAIDNMFPKNMPEKIVTCSSTHKSKGKEWKRVFVLESTYMLKKGNQKEEANLVYVARTRAINSLFRVKGK